MLLNKIRIIINYNYSIRNDLIIRIELYLFGIYKSLNADKYPKNFCR